MRSCTRVWMPAPWPVCACVRLAGQPTCVEYLQSVMCFCAEDASECRVSGSSPQNLRTHQTPSSHGVVSLALEPLH